MADNQQLPPRINRLIELEVSGRIKPEHQTELNVYRARGQAPMLPKGLGQAGVSPDKRSDLSGEIENLRNLQAGIDDIQSIYDANFKGGGPSALVEYLPGQMRPSNQMLRDAGERQSAFIARALGLTGQQFNTPAEQKLFIGSFMPSPTDRDEVITSKIEALQRLHDTAQARLRAQMGTAAQPVPTAESPSPTATSDNGQGSDEKEILGAGEATERAIDKAAGVTDKDISLERGGYYVDPETGLLTVRISAGQDEPAPVERGSGGIAEGADAFVRGAADTATLGFADELAAAGDTIFRGGTMRDNLLRQRAVDKYDAENSPYLRGVGQLAGAIAPVGAGRIGLGARGPREMARTGATLGALYGAGSGETLGERFTGAASGAAAGAGTGLALGKLSDLYMARRAAGPSARSQEAATLRDASNDLGVDLLPADVGGVGTRWMTAGTAITPGGVMPITRAARRSQEQAAGALDTIAAREGVAADTVAAGEAARSGALSYRSSSRDRIGRQYERAAEAAGNTRVAPERAVAALDRNIAELSEVPGGADGLSVLSTLRDDIAKRGSVSIDGIRGMRTQLRQKFMKEGLVGSDIERRVASVLDAAGDDVAASLNAAGKSEAADLYRAADRAWKERAKTMDEVIMPIIGKKDEKSGEQIVAALNSAAKGNNARLDKFFNALPDEEAGAVRATLITQMGRAKPGAQNAAGDEFSLDTFLTNWNSIGQGAKNTLFRGENRKAIDQLALIAEKSKASGRYKNFSNTAPTLAAGSLVTGATYAIDMATLGAVLGSQFAVGSLLASPKVAKAMLNIARAKTPEAAKARIGALSQVATRDPTVRNEVLQLQQKLVDSFGISPTTRAAADNEQPVRSEPVR